MSRLTTCFALAFVVLAVSFTGVAHAQNSTQQIDQLKERLQSNPDDIGVRLQLINVLFMNGNYREVIEISEKAIEMMPTRSSLYYFTGESFRRLGNFDSAYIRLKKGYEVRTYTDLSESYGMVLLRLRKTTEAAPVLQVVAKEKAVFIDNHLAAGSQAYKNGNLETATDEFLAVYTVDKSKLSQEQFAFMQFNLNFQSYVENNNPDAAVKAFVATLKARFGSDYGFDNVGEAFRCLIEQRKIDVARSLFEEFNKLPASAISQDLIDSKFFSTSYGMMVQCGKLKDIARSLFQKKSLETFGLTAIDLTPLFSLYDFLLTQGANQLASDLTNKVMDKSPTIEEPYLRLSMILIQSNRIEDAMLAIRKYFVKEKIDELGYTNDFVQSFQAILNQGKSGDANSVLLQLGGLNTKDLSSTYVTLGELFTKLGNGEKAIAILNKVIAIDPGNHVASLKLGEAYYSAGRYDDIIRSLANTTDSEGLRFLALGYEKKVMLPEANKTWQTYLVSMTDTARVREANEHIRQNTIVLMSPQYQQLRAQAATTTSPLQLAVIKPAGAVEDNTRGLALITSDNSTVTFEGYAGSDAPIDTIMVNGMMVRGVTPTPDEINAAHLSKAYVLRFTADISLPAAQKSQVQVLTTDSLGNRAVKNYVVDVQAQRASTNTLPTIRAFVVGVSQYADKSLSLKYAEDDANLFYQRMRDPTTIGIPASNIVLLTNDAATRAGILEGLESVFKNSFENDVIMIYLAMHGVTDEGLLYFIPYDAKVTKLRTTAISGLDFDYLIKTKGVGRKVIMFVDACHSGAAGSSLVFGGTRAVEALPLLLAEMAKSQPGLSLFSASDAGQVSREGEEWGGHGVFTYYLLKSMTTPAANANADQFIQLREIVDYVRDKVSADTKGKQTPVFKCFGCDPNMPLFYSK
jgi:tetratricopeptide (TPR) repeat protein